MKAIEPDQLAALAESVALVQDKWLERALPLEPARDAFLLRVGATRRRPRALWLAAAAVALGAFMSAGVIWGMKLLAPRPVLALVRDKATSADTWIHSQPSERIPIDFSDGSRITLQPGSRVRIAELRPNGATLAIESGALDVSVKHRVQTDYRLSLGPFLVRVTGTQFDVSFSPEQDLLRLNMRDGTVVVSGCALGDPRPVRAGESLMASCRDSHFEISRGQAAAEVPAAPSVPVPTVTAETSHADAAHAASRATRAEIEPSWQALARAGKFGKALNSVDGAGFANECERSSSSELALLADVARFGHRPDDAILALSTLRQRFPGTQRASEAAFNIARVHFDQRGAYHEAARWFRTYLKEQPAGALARESQGRLMEALYRAGDRDGALRVADEYLAANPDGPHARLARTLLGR